MDRQNELTYKIDLEDPDEIRAAIEVLLFSAGDPVPFDVLAAVMEIDKQTLRHVLDGMFEGGDGVLGRTGMSGIAIRHLKGCYTLCTRPQYIEYIRTLVEPHTKQGLSNAAFETLAIVAYNSPVTRARVEEIRGVNSDSAINRLIERGLIREAGRMEVPGRPILFETTQEFLKQFGELAKIEEIEGVEIEKADEADEADEDEEN